MNATVKVGSSLSEEFDPDIINISISIEGVGDDKQGAVKEYNARYDALVGGLAAAGVPKEEITTSYLYLSPEWKDNYYKKTRQRTGRYEFSATMNFSIPCDEDFYERIWGAIIALDLKGISTDLDYGLKDYEGAREKIIRRAVEAGKRRATLLADATGCDLGQVVHIENDLRGNSCYGRDFAAGSAPAGGPDESEAPVFNPSPVDVSCEVTLEYALVARQG